MENQIATVIVISHSRIIKVTENDLQDTFLPYRIKNKAIQFYQIDFQDETSLLC